MAKKGKIVWTPKGAFVMPILPETLCVDPLLASLLHTVAFLELSDDDTVDPDWAVEAMEHVSYYLGRMSAEQVQETQAQLDRVAAHAKETGLPDDFVELAQEFLRDCGLGDDDDDEDVSR